MLVKDMKTNIIFSPIKWGYLFEIKIEIFFGGIILLLLGL